MNENIAIRDRLIGTWRLQSFTGIDESSEMLDIMGADASGFICYSSDGWVSVQIVAANRPRYDIPDTAGGTDAQTLAAARGMFAYAGQFVTDENVGVVYHELEFALIPNWVGSRQKRYVTFSDETTLVLTADPVRIGIDGKRRRTELVWVRIK